MGWDDPYIYFLRTKDDYQMKNASLNGEIYDLKDKLKRTAKRELNNDDLTFEEHDQM